MQAVWEYLAEFNTVTVILRVILAAVAGALVGLEREFHGRAAGMRTHMMVALGAALTSMIGLYVCFVLEFNSDPMRVAAQVISGVGFLGAGTILLRGGGSRITGLTTGAGLWAAAAIGLAVGAGCIVMAIAAADMALAGIQSFIPLDEVIDAMYQIGCAMPSCIRETAEGGLATTPTGLAAKRRMF